MDGFVGKQFCHIVIACYKINYAATMLCTVCRKTIAFLILLSAALESVDSSPAQDYESCDKWICDIEQSLQVSPVTEYLRSIRMTSVRLRKDCFCRKVRNTIYCIARTHWQKGEQYHENHSRNFGRHTSSQ
jgi:hypothetical protein